MADYNSSYTGPQIDTAVGKALNPDTTPTANSTNLVTSGGVKNAINTVDESIAIRVSGNKTTYASGAAIGQYVIVDGSSIAGITDGLYKAAKAIPYNTVIDSTYLTAASVGGLNDLMSAFGDIQNISSNVTKTPAVSWFNSSACCYRVGKMIFVTLNGVFTNSATGTANIFTGLPYPAIGGDMYISAVATTTAFRLIHHYGNLLLDNVSSLAGLSFNICYSYPAN